MNAGLVAAITISSGHQHQFEDEATGKLHPYSDRQYPSLVFQDWLHPANWHDLEQAKIGKACCCVYCMCRT